MSRAVNESAIRSRAKSRGFFVCKSRAAEDADHRGQFPLVDDRNTVVMGDRFDASLEDIAWYMDNH